MLVWFAIYFDSSFRHHPLYTSFNCDYSLSLNEFLKGRCHLVTEWELFPLSCRAPAAELTLIRISSGSAVLQGEGFNPLLDVVSSMEWVWGKRTHEIPLSLIFPAQSLSSSRNRPHFLPQPESFCVLPGCAHRSPMAPQGIALLLPQLQSVHISLN